MYECVRVICVSVEGGCSAEPELTLDVALNYTESFFFFLFETGSLLNLELPGLSRPQEFSDSDSNPVLGIQAHASHHPCILHGT